MTMVATTTSSSMTENARLDVSIWFSLLGHRNRPGVLPQLNRRHAELGSIHGYIQRVSLQASVGTCLSGRKPRVRLSASPDGPGKIQIAVSVGVSGDTDLMDFRFPCRSRPVQV